MKSAFQCHIFRETFIMVASGLAINYPLGVFLTWLFLDHYLITNPVILATLMTFSFTLVAFIRVYSVRYYSEKRKLKKTK